MNILAQLHSPRPACARDLMILMLHTHCDRTWESVGRAAWLLLRRPGLRGRRTHSSALHLERANLLSDWFDSSRPCFCWQATEDGVRSLAEHLILAERWLSELYLSPLQRLQPGWSKETYGQLQGDKQPSPGEEEVSFIHCLASK